MATRVRPLRHTFMLMTVVLAAMWAMNFTLDVLFGWPTVDVWAIRAVCTVATVAAFVFIAVQGRQRRLREQRHPFGPPEVQPQGLRALLKNGSEVPLDCVYDGPRGQHHAWEIQGEKPEGFVRLLLDVKPENAIFTWYSGPEVSSRD